MKTYPTLIPLGGGYLIIEQTATQRGTTEDALDREVLAIAQPQGRWPFNASATACFGGGCKITGEET